MFESQHRRPLSSLTDSRFLQFSEDNEELGHVATMQTAVWLVTPCSSVRVYRRLKAQQFS